MKPPNVPYPQKKALHVAEKHQQEKYEILFNTMLDGYALHEIICDEHNNPVDYRFLDVNPAFEKITGLTRQTVLGKTVLEVLPHTEPIWIQRYGHVALTGEPTHFKEYAQELDKHFEVTAFRPRDRQFACIFVDRTQQIMAEKALRESEARYRELFENMSSGVAVYEAINDGDDFIFKDFNRRGESIDQIDRTQIIGHNVKEIFPGVVEFGLFDVLQRVWKTGKPEHHPISLYKDRRIDGWRHNFVYKLPSGEIVAMYDDITKQKQAEQALQESEERFRRLFEQAPLGYQSLDAQGCFLDVNQAWLDLLGYSRDQVIGHWFGDFLAPDEVKAFKKRFTRFKTIGHVSVDIKMMQRTGAILLVHIDGRIGYDKHGRFKQTHCILHNITEQREQEQRILDYQHQLKHLASELTLTEERLRRDVAAQLHDTISQTLAMINVEIASLRETLSDEALRGSLDDIKESLARTLEQSRALTSQLCYPVLNVLGFEKAVEKWLADEIGAKYNIHTVYENDSHEKPLDEDIRAVLFRGVRELLMNVVKHAQATTVSVSLTRRNNHIVIVIKDDGQGCDLEKNVYQSKGFGILSIQEALQRLGGQVTFASESHAGFKAIMIAPLKIKNNSQGR